MGRHKNPFQFKMIQLTALVRDRSLKMRYTVLRLQLKGLFFRNWWKAQREL
jgi:hypothetical protein